jgi:hypothetical protein
MFRLIQPDVTSAAEQKALLLKETAIGIAAIELAAETFSKGTPLFVEMAEIQAERYLKPENNKLFQIYDKLRLFGYEGVYSDDMFPADEMYHAYAFLQSTNFTTDIFSIETSGTCEVVFQAAFARCKLDRNRNPPATFLDGAGQDLNYEDYLPGGWNQGLIPYELALLARMNEKAVRNSLLADSELQKFKPETSKYMELSVDDSLVWLLRTRGFTPSKLNREQPKGAIEVPISRDGSFFSVHSRRPSGFFVGKKGAEISYATFHDALEALNKMDTPYWRRPNAQSGVHGIVRGVDIVYKTPAELGLVD